MKPSKKIIEKAVEDGAIERMSKLLSFAHLLNCIANNAYEEASDLMQEYGLNLGLLKKRHGDFVRSADIYFKEFGSMVGTEQQKADMFSDMDELEVIVRKWAKI